jgi:hypothetical protein
MVCAGFKTGQAPYLSAKAGRPAAHLTARRVRQDWQVGCMS